MVAPIEAPIVVLVFAAIAGAAEGLKVAEVVAATEGEGDDVVDAEVLGGAAALALVPIAIENVLPNSGRNGNSGSFTGLSHGKLWESAS